MGKVRVAIAGVGNCASALIQGCYYYRYGKDTIGLTFPNLGGLTPKDIEFVAAFDVNEKKVGKDLSEAIFEEPNNTVKIVDVPRLDVKVKRAPLLDGIGKYLKDVVKVSDKDTVNVSEELKNSEADILINYVPVGSVKAAKFYAEEALKANTAFINGMPTFIASDESWSKRFQDKNLPIAGDDIMSQLGATVLHKTLVKLCVDRGVRVDETYQLNLGGDTDFLNMLEEARLKEKRESKTSSVIAMADYNIPVRIGPSDYVNFLNNDKVCYIWIKGRYFGLVPLTMEVKLHVVDAYNSAGIMIDAIRGTKIALNRGIGGALISLSAFCFKHPPLQMPYQEAKRAFIEFVEGKRER
ncbi:MAG: inositol-3-phosphate synthase [Nitrososphaerales archaeon]